MALSSVDQVKRLIMAVPERMFKRLDAHTVCLCFGAEVVMDARICNYAPAFLLLAALGAAGCDDNGVSPSADDLTGPATLTSAIVTVEPAAVRAEFLSSPFCHTASPFQTRFSIGVRAHQEMIVTGIRFEFLDRFGGRSVPTSIPSSSPIPMPGTSPITTPGTSPIPIPVPGTSPIPGSGTFDGLLISPGRLLTLPFLLQFHCGVPAWGTLFGSVDMIDRRGTLSVSRVSVRIDDD
jgi:hypothetical protein